MTQDSTPRLRGLHIPAGVVLFLVANLVVGVIANPRFPNQRGPVPGWLPWAMLGGLVALGRAALRDEGWRKVATGFVIAWFGLALWSRGGFTTTFNELPMRLDPTRGWRMRRAAAAERARQVEENRAEDAQRAAEDSAARVLRTRLARVAVSASACLFRHRDRHPELGFAVTSEELADGGPGCAQWVDTAASRRGGFRVRVGRIGRTPGQRVERASLIIEPHPVSVGRRFPYFSLDAHGMLTKREDSSEPYLMATPLPALLELRECLLLAPPAARDSSADLRALLRTVSPACADFAGRSEAIPAEGPPPARPGIRLCLRIDGRQSCGGDVVVARYAVRWEPAGDGFRLRAQWDGVHPARRFLVTPDGSVHATGAARDATEADPRPYQCEFRPDIHC